MKFKYYYTIGKFKGYFMLNDIPGELWINYRKRVQKEYDRRGIERHRNQIQTITRGQEFLIM